MIDLILTPPPAVEVYGKMLKSKSRYGQLGATVPIAYSSEESRQKWVQSIQGVVYTIKPHPLGKYPSNVIYFS